MDDDSERREARRRSMRRLVAERRARGLCPRCEEPMDREGYLCRACADLHAERARARRAARDDAGHDRPEA